MAKSEPTTNLVLRNRSFIQHDEIALEDHSYVATQQEVGTRGHGHLLCMEKVIQGHSISAVTFERRSKHAKYCSTIVQQSLEVETNLSLLQNKSDNGLINNLKASKNTIIDLKLPQDGERIHLRHHDGKQAATCGQLGAGIRGKHHPGLKSNFSFSSLFRDVISLARNLISWQSTTARHVFLMPSLLRSLVVRVYSHTFTSMHLHGSRKKRIFVSHLKTLHPRRAMPYTLQNLTPCTGTPSSPFPEPVFQHSEQPCQDQRPKQRGALTETPPLTGYEANRIVEDRDPGHCTGDGQFTGLEDLRVRPLVLPRVDHSVDLRFCGKHRDAPGVGL